MKPAKILSEELAWSGEHASEVAIVALADAQTELLPADVVLHVETCAHCCEALAEAALLSLQTADALTAMPQSERASHTALGARGVPWRMLLAALGVAGAGAVPALLDARGLSGSAVSMVRSAPLVMRGVRHAVQSAGLPLWMTLGSAALLIVISVVLTRALPSPASRRIES